MTVTDITTDVEARTLVVTTRFDAPVERVWQLWADPRQLERWWGPPTYPATFVAHDLRPGGAVSYFMTGPEGDRHHGWWTITAVDAPHRLELDDGFADQEGNPNPELPVTQMRVDIAADGDATQMVITSTYPSTEAMEQVLAMGMVEGITAALGQIEAILADVAA
ncbi:MAG: SRPBCC domain-containing protein [Acidimicrobiales bacterium]|nr:SRPBCC domain-containing protein [Acidimicrobiales bacterium]